MDREYNSLALYDVREAHLTHKNYKSYNFFKYS